MEAPQIEIYTTSYCPFCDAAKQLLKSRGLDFTEINVDDPKKKEALKNKTGWRTVPQIFIEGKLIGGYQELAEMDQKGLLKV